MGFLGSGRKKDFAVDGAGVLDKLNLSAMSGAPSSVLRPPCQTSTLHLQPATSNHQRLLFLPLLQRHQRRL